MLGLRPICSAPIASLLSGLTIYLIEIEQTITVTDSIAAQYIANINLEQDLTLNSSVAQTGVYNLPINQNLTLSQTIFSAQNYTVNIEQDLDLLSDFRNLIELDVEQELTLTDDETPTVLTPIIQNLSLSDLISPTMVSTNEFISNLNLTHNVLVGKVYYLEICHFLNLQQKLGTVHDISVESELVLDLFPVDIFEHELVLEQTLETNFLVSCKYPDGYFPENSLNQTLTLTDELTVQTIYNCNVTMNLGVAHSVFWRN